MESSSHDQPSANLHRRRSRNVFRLLVEREISPQLKFVPRKRWGERHADWSYGTNLNSWVEAESLQNLSAIDCPLVPLTMSTIAVAFSSDGRTLASAHGDHTVNIIDSETGNCLQVLRGHQMTPLVVRFHPLHSETVASGSLDHEVRLWNTTTSECIRSHVFYRHVASIAFHAGGELLAVASGRKLHIWHYKKRGEDSSPVVVLKTKRSLRAVHFHPHGVPLLLTAEVSDLKSSNSALTRAISPPPSDRRSSSAAKLPVAVQPIQRNRVSREVPFLQSWLMAQSLADSFSMARPSSSRGHVNSTNYITSLEAALVSLQIPRDPISQSRFAGSAPTMIPPSELPCIVKLRLWSHDIRDPYAMKCRLTIHHAILFSEMGTHFSPCGKYLAACVACVIPHNKTESGPTRHPVTAHEIMYELRVYSLEKESFGSVVVSREIRAAHCLTSIQFSPTSEHIMLSYGQNHDSLMMTFIRGRFYAHTYGQRPSEYFTILEIYRVSDMKLVSFLPNSEDKITSACFHPYPGGGFAYGTKDGEVRIFRYNTAAILFGKP